MTAVMSPLFIGETFLDIVGKILAGGKLYTYLAGTTTLTATYTDNTLLVPNANPIILNSAGKLSNEIWWNSGTVIKFVIHDSNDAPVSSPTLDNIPGLNDSQMSSASEWQAGPAPTYVSATSFTMTGNQAAILPANIAIKTTNVAGTIYSTVVSSSFNSGTGLTTVTVINKPGSSLDAGLSALSYSLLSAPNVSLPYTRSIGGVPLWYGRTLFPNSPINLGISATVATNALTISITGADGNAPTPYNPIYIPTRDVTAGTGDAPIVIVNSVDNLVISSGSTLGTSNNVPFRLWIVMFNDTSPFIGVINCLSGRSVYPLSPWGIGSSTAEGGSGGADSVQVIYTGNAVTAKPYVVIGYVSYESGLATVGTWASAPTRVQPYITGMPMPGQVAQIQRNDTGAVATGTTVVPLDDTIPQITEGDQYLSQAITPSSTANLLRITSRMILANSAGSGGLIASLFQDATANALVTTSLTQGAASGMFPVDLSWAMIAGTTSATTIMARAGGSAAGTTTLNGSGSARKFGGVANSFIQVEEIMS